MRLSAIIFLICVLGLASPSQAQIKILPRERLDAVDSPRLSADSSSLAFDTRHIKAAPMREDDSPQVFRYEMTNVGKDELNVLRLQTTCSCFSATIGQKLLKPGEKTVLTVRYDPKGHLGRFEHKVFVYTGPGTSPAAILTFSVEVQGGSDCSGLYQVQMGSIRLRSTEVVFRKGRRAVENIKFLNQSGSPMKLECEKMFLPDCIRFETRPAVVEDGCEGEIVLTYEPGEGEIRDEIPLILKGLGVSPGKSTVKIRFE